LQATLGLVPETLEAAHPASIEQLSLFRLNHRLPRAQTHPEVV
jgi:hypothetical protein